MGVEAAALEILTSPNGVLSFTHFAMQQVARSSLLFLLRFSLQEAFHIEFGYRCVRLFIRKHSKYLINDEEMQLEPIKFINYSLAPRSLFGQLLLPWKYSRIMLGEFP